MISYKRQEGQVAVETVDHEISPDNAVGMGELEKKRRANSLGW
jgi:hypothetical protein